MIDGTFDEFVDVLEELLMHYFNTSLNDNALLELAEKICSVWDTISVDEMQSLLNYYGVWCHRDEVFEFNEDVYNILLNGDLEG